MKEELEPYEHLGPLWTDCVLTTSLASPGAQWYRPPPPHNTWACLGPEEQDEGKYVEKGNPCSGLGFISFVCLLLIT